MKSFFKKCGIALCICEIVASVVIASTQPADEMIYTLFCGAIFGFLLFLLLRYNPESTPKEYEFTCQRCGAKWYMTPAEIKESKKLEKDIWRLKTRRIGTMMRTHDAFTEKIAFVERLKKSTKKCPQCGSCEIIRTEGNEGADINDMYKM